MNQLQRELDLYTRHAFMSRVYDLTIYSDNDDEKGTPYRVMPRDVQYHPIQNKLYCANYLRYFPGRIIDLPIEYTNEEESPAMKRGGFIAPVSRYVPCVIEEGVDIPKHVELDCTGVTVGDVVRMDRIVFQEGVNVSNHIDVKGFLVGTCFGRRRGEDEEEGFEKDGGEEL